MSQTFESESSQPCTAVLAAGGLLAAAAVYAAYYLRYVSRVPRVFGKPTPYRQELLRRCPSLSRRYSPPVWLPGAHAATIAMTALRSGPSIPYEREFLDTPDGGAIAVDLCFPDKHTGGDDVKGNHRGCSGDRSPILLVLHGLTGGSHEAYVRGLADRVLNELGWAVAVHNFRGCGGSPLLNETPYSAATTEDVRGTIAYLRGRFPRRPLFACGFSLGANVLTKTLGEMGSECPVEGAIAMCNPFDCLVGSETMMSSAMGRLYSRKLASNLSRFARGHRHVLGNSPHVDLDAGLRAGSVRDFDEYLTRRNFGYGTVEEYYADASSSRFVRRIRVPFVALSALDDPIAVREAIPYAECIANPAVTLVTTEAGGHVAWPEGALASPGSLSSWAETVCVEMLGAMHEIGASHFAAERRDLTFKKAIDHLRYYRADDPSSRAPKPGSIWSPQRAVGSAAWNESGYGDDLSDEDGNPVADDEPQRRRRR